MNVEKILDILKEEIVPAEGCTEPIALAYASAMATSILGSIQYDKKCKIS